MMNLLFDALVLLVLAFFVWRGASKGFVLTLCGFLAVIVALVGASLLSNTLADPVSKLMEPMITERIQSTLDSSVHITTESSTAEEADDIPLPGVVDQLKNSKLLSGIAKSFQTAVNDGKAQVVTSAARSVAHYAAVQFARCVLFVVGFVLILLAWFVLSRALDLVARLPGLHSLNKLCGGAIGLLKGCIILFILSWFLRVSGWQPSAEVEAKTYLARFFLETNPISFLGGT